jgi:Cupin domain
VLESLAPCGDSPPLHVHWTEDELFHVLDGELRLQVADQDLRVGAGEATLAPKGIPHTYRVESPEGARWLVITTRGDFERFVRAFSRPAETPALPATAGPPTPEQAEALAVAPGSTGSSSSERRSAHSAVASSRCGAVRPSRARTSASPGPGAGPSGGGPQWADPPPRLPLVSPQASPERHPRSGLLRRAGQSPTGVPGVERRPAPSR